MDSIQTLAQFINSIFSRTKRVSRIKKQRPFFTMPTQKSLNQILAFLIFSACTKSVNLNSSFLRYFLLDPLQHRDQIGHKHILTIPNQNIFEQLLIFVNLYQHAKNKAVSSICSGEIIDLKILQSDWLRAFWSILETRFFPNTGLV